MISPIILYSFPSHLIADVKAIQPIIHTITDYSTPTPNILHASVRPSCLPPKGGGQTEKLNDVVSVFRLVSLTHSLLSKNNDDDGFGEYDVLCVSFTVILNREVH